MTSTNIFVNQYELNSKFENKFFRIHTFDTVQTADIFNLNFQLYFDIFGNVSVETPQGIMTLNYRNPTATNKPMALNNPVNKVSLDKRRDKNRNPYNVVFSPNMLWILYKGTVTQKDISDGLSNLEVGTYCYLLFNFFHTEDYKNYYKNNRENSINLYHDYCKKTYNLDPGCSCLPINGDACAERLLPEAMINTRKGSQAYNAFTAICQHTEPGCLSITSFPNSFLNQYYIDNPRPPNVNVVLCSTSFNAGGNIGINKAEVQQKCQITGDDSIGIVMTEQPTSKPITGGTTPPPTTTPSSDQQEKNFLDKYLNYSQYKTAYGILGIVIILSVFGGAGYYYWRKKKSEKVAPPSVS